MNEAVISFPEINLQQLLTADRQRAAPNFDIPDGSGVMKKRKRINPVTTRNSVKLVRGGKPYFDCLLQLIAGARDIIHLQVYIYSSDGTGRQVADALKAAVKRGVKAYLLVDGYEARVLSRAFMQELKDAGIHFRLFNPLFKSRYFYFGRRLHQKVIVVDSVYSMVGGINIADRYNDVGDEPAWLDFALYAEGEIAKELCILCWKSWNDYQPVKKLETCEMLIDPDRDTQWPLCQVAMRRNDWVRRKNEISSTYISMLRMAKNEVIILCSYFLPGRIIRRHLSAAMERGIKIKVVTAGISDIPVTKNAEKFMYDWLLRNNIEIYEYRKAVLHGKVAVCDEEWMTIGSYNINNISAYASIELNMEVRDAAFAAETTRILQRIIDTGCERVTPENHARARNVFKQFTRWASYSFIRVMIYIFTFYFRRRE